MIGPSPIGKMRERVIVRGEQQSLPNEYGEPVIVAADLVEVWAAVEPQGGVETLRAGRVESEAVYQVTMRFIPWLTTKHWLGWRGKRLEIDSAKDVEARGEWHVCVCRATGVDS